MRVRDEKGAPYPLIGVVIHCGLFQQRMSWREVNEFKSVGYSSFQRLLLDIFLPAGYPESVTADYTRYQIFDSLQAFCSYLTLASPAHT